MDPQALVPDLLKLPPLGKFPPPRKYRSRFPAALKRAAEAADEAQLRFAENPLQFEAAFCDPELDLPQTAEEAGRVSSPLQLVSGEQPSVGGGP